MTRATPPAPTTDLPDGYRMTELGPLPEEWRVVRFEDAVLKRKIMVAKVRQREYRQRGRFPIVDQGRGLIAGYWDNEAEVYKGPLPVIVFGDHTRIFKYVDFPFVCGAEGTKILVPNIERFFPRFLYYAFLTLKIPSRGYNRHFRLLREQLLPLPPLPEQRAIAHVLRAVQEAREATERVIAALRDLKRSLMRHLFTYGPVPVDAADQVALQDTPVGPIPAHWRVVRLGEVADLTMGQSPPSSTYNTHGEGLPFLQGKAEFGDIYPQPVKWCSTPLRVAKRGSVLISVRAPVGDVNLAQRDYCIGRGLAALSGKELLNNDFLFYFLLNAKSHLEGKGTGSTFKSINKSVLQNFPIPLPPLDEQRQIARILQTVDRKIEAEEARKEALDELFRSLLHHLMTAKIRLPQGFVQRFAEGSHAAG